MGVQLMKTILHIAKKEILEALRDKRVSKSVFLTPAMVSIFILVLMSQLTNMLAKAENQKVHVLGKENSIVKALKEKKVNVITLQSRQEAETLVKDGKARLVMVFPDNFDQSLAENKSTEVEAIYNPDEQSSQLSLSVVQAQFREVNKLALSKLLQEKGIDKDQAEPLHLRATKIQVSTKGASDFLIGIIPYILIIWGFFGGMATASDMVAGEKDKSTLETLLITPITRGEIVAGKLLGLITICLLSSFSALFGLILGSKLPFAKSELMDQSLNISAPAALTIIAIQIPLVVFFASVLIAISSLARNPREAQQRMSALSSVVTMPAVFSQFLGYTDLANNPIISLIPILNAASCIRKALLGKFPPLEIAGTIGVCLLLATVALFYASRLFKNEKVLLRI